MGGDYLQGYLSKLSASTTVVHRYPILDSVLVVLMFHVYGRQTDNQTAKCLNHSIMPPEVVLSNKNYINPMYLLLCHNLYQQEYSSLVITVIKIM